MCVPHTPYTPVLKFVPLAGRVSGAATHAVGIDAGYGLLPSGEVCGAATHAVSGGCRLRLATYLEVYATTGRVYGAAKHVVGGDTRLRFVLTCHMLRLI